MPSSEKRNHHITGNIGLYFACYHLSKLGWNVMAATRNARGVDVIAYDSRCKRTLAIQVKTLSIRNPVPLGQSLDRFVGDWWIIVTKAADPQPVCYVMKPREVKNRAHRGVKDGKISYWLQPNSYDKKRFKEAWHRIGTAN